MTSLGLGCCGRLEPAAAVATGALAKPLAEGSGEDFVTVESAGQGDVEDRVAAGQQHHGGLAQAQSHRVLLGGFAGGSHKEAMEMELGEFRLGGQTFQRDIFIAVLRQIGEQGLDPGETVFAGSRGLERALRRPHRHTIPQRRGRILDDSCGVENLVAG